MGLKCAKHYNIELPHPNKNSDKPKPSESLIANTNHQKNMSV